MFQSLQGYKVAVHFINFNRTMFSVQDSESLIVQVGSGGQYLPGCSSLQEAHM